MLRLGLSLDFTLQPDRSGARPTGSSVSDMVAEASLSSSVGLLLRLSQAMALWGSSTETTTNPGSNYSRWPPVSRCLQVSTY